MAIFWYHANILTIVINWNLHWIKITWLSKPLSQLFYLTIRTILLIASIIYVIKWLLLRHQFQTYGLFIKILPRHPINSYCDNFIIYNRLIDQMIINLMILTISKAMTFYTMTSIEFYLMIIFVFYFIFFTLVLAMILYSIYFHQYALCI